MFISLGQEHIRKPRRRRISSPVCACMPHSITYIIMMGRGMTLVVTVTELISTSFENFSFRMHVCMNETKWKVFWESISSVSFYGLGGLEEYSLLAAMPWVHEWFIDTFIIQMGRCGGRSILWERVRERAYRLQQRCELYSQMPHIYIFLPEIRIGILDDWALEQRLSFIPWNMGYWY
jgi:hypothetical protein